ncbi:type 1 glutamine amidotransferase [Lutimaribacter marinistellae]|uniref:Type 1 glutamine amidotransferase n=1 Tax=Lutimaribacter marinistellae TaxID=1820329 RepID=A0ABV7TEU3_9RHOB
MTRILILESNAPEIVARGIADAAPFLDTLPQLSEELTLTVAEPYVAPLTPALLDEAEAVIFTGSGVAWCVDDPRAEPLAQAMRTVFDRGLPVWGSCNGMQLAAHVLGGAVGASPNGNEDGVARDMRLTEAGRAHPMMAGRADGFAVPCVHRDEVQHLPDGAVLLAGNDHSPIQAFAYERDGVDFWGVQYHPESSPAQIAGWIDARQTRTAEMERIADAMRDASADPENARRLGVDPADLTLHSRARELMNWLAHIKNRTST